MCLAVSTCCPHTTAIMHGRAKAADRQHDDTATFLFWTPAARTALWHTLHTQKKCFEISHAFSIQSIVFANLPQFNHIPYRKCLLARAVPWRKLSCVNMYLKRKKITTIRCSLALKCLPWHLHTIWASAHSAEQAFPYNRQQWRGTVVSITGCVC